MSTVFEVALAGESPRQARAAAEAAFAELDRLERLLNRFDQGSELSLINRLAPGESLRVGIDTAHCLWLAKRAQRETGGAFDVTAGPLADCWRSPEGKLRQPGEQELAAVLGVMKMECLELFELSQAPAGAETAVAAEAAGAGETAGDDLWRARTLDSVELVDWRQADAPRAFQVRVRADKAPDTKGKSAAIGLTVDLGGIGKGFALDRAAEVLMNWEVKAALLHGGTSTALAFGEPPADEGWPLGVGGQWRKEAGMDKLLLKSGALSGSGVELKGAHIVDPRTGRAAAGSLAAWAYLPDETAADTAATAKITSLADAAAMADAYSTAFMVMSADEVEEFCARHPEISALKIERVRGEVSARRFGPWPGAGRTFRSASNA